jgi:SPP1 gp7 family putative phage head morphogenesis protein
MILLSRTQPTLDDIFERVKPRDNGIESLARELEVVVGGRAPFGRPGKRGGSSRTRGNPVLMTIDGKPAERLGAYGEYWLDPNGNFERAHGGHTNHAHQRFPAEVERLGTEYGGEIDMSSAYDVMANHNFLRVVVESNGRILYSPLPQNRITKEQRGALQVAGIMGNAELVEDPVFLPHHLKQRVIWRPPEHNMPLAAREAMAREWVVSGREPILAARPRKDSDVSVKAVIRDEDGCVLLLDDAGSGFWDLPGGHARVGENLNDALAREIREETGLTVDSARQFKTAMLKLGSQTRPAVLYEVTVAGHQPEVKISSEHLGYQWVTKDKALAMNAGAFDPLLRKLFRGNDAIVKPHEKRQWRAQKIYDDALHRVLDWAKQEMLKRLPRRVRASGSESGQGGARAGQGVEAGGLVLAGGPGSGSWEAPGQPRFAHVMRLATKEYTDIGIPEKDITHGHCVEWANAVKKQDPSVKVMEVNPWARVGLERHPYHAWVEKDGLHFDAQHTEGVKDFRDLTYFKEHPNQDYVRRLKIREQPPYNNRMAHTTASEPVMATEPLVIDFMFDLKGFAKRFTAAVREAGEKVIRVSARGVLGEAGDGKKFTNKRIIREFTIARKNKLKNVSRGIYDDIKARLEASVVAGDSERVMADKIRRAFDQTYEGRAETVARTETACAYATANLQAIKEAGYTHKKWVSAHDDDVRDAHDELDGVVIPIEDKFEAIGPSGETDYVDGPCDPKGEAWNTINCFLPGTKVSGRFVAASKAFYSGSAWSIETANGNRLRVTPNHPILTVRGWVLAKHLCKGDQLLAARRNIHTGADAISTAVQEVNDENSEALVEDVFEAFAVNGCFGVAASDSDFYGDGRCLNGDIHIARSNWMLQGGFETAMGEPVTKLAFKLSNSCLPQEAGFCSGNSPLQRISRAPSRLPCGFQHDFGIGGAGALPAQTHRIGYASDWDAVAFKATKQRGASGVDFAGQLKKAYPGQIFTDEVVNAVEFKFSGHVYDLESDVGYLFAEHIASSNCRCVLVAAGEVEATRFDEDGFPLAASEPVTAKRPFDESKHRREYGRFALKNAIREELGTGASNPGKHLVT